MSTLCVCVWVCLLALQPCICVCVCVCVGAWCLLFPPHQRCLSSGPSCSPQTLGVGFHSLQTPSAAARGRMISNTWEPWDPTQRWNNGGPVSIRARNRTRRQAVMMSESFTPTHAPPSPLPLTKTPRLEKRKSYSHKAPLMTSCTYTLASRYGEEDLLASSRAPVLYLLKSLF